MQSTKYNLLCEHRMRFFHGDRFHLEKIIQIIIII